MNKVFAFSWVVVAILGIGFPDHLVAFQRTLEVSEGVKEEILQVERGLGAAFRVKGDSPSTWTLEDRMEHYRVPGVSVAVVKDGKLRWAKGYGIANTRTEALVDVDTLFQAGSISKPVAALAALKLVDDGKVDLDEDINLYLKDWKVPNNEFTTTEKVTLRRLLTHTAGMTVHGFPGYAKGEDFPSTTQVLDGEGNTDSIRVDKTPGESWRYSGGGYTVMQKMVEDVSGMPFGEFLDQEILSHMEMTESTYQQPLPDSLHERASGAYNFRGSLIKGDWHSYPEMAAAGLWTTPSDLAKYCIAIQDIVAGKGDGILSKSLTLEMLTKHQGDWGLGPSLADEDESLIFQHGGKNAGFTNDMFAYANRGDAVIVMTSGDNGGALIREIMRSIADVYQWRGQTEWIESLELDEESLERLAGKYTTEFDGRSVAFTFKAVKNALEVSVPMEAETKTIIPVGELEFVDVSDGTKVTFKQDDAGAIKGFSLNGQVEFSKSEKK